MGSRSRLIVVLCAFIAACAHPLGAAPPAPDAAPSADPKPTGPVFLVHIAPDHDGPVSGRLTIYLVANDSSIDRRTPPAAGPFFADPQPLYALDITAANPDDRIRIDDTNTTGFPGPMRDLPAGPYRAQAVLDMHRDASSWHGEPGNLYSSPVDLEIVKGQTIAVPLELARVAPPEPNPSVLGARYFSMISTRLTAFHGKPVEHKVGVALPIGYEKGRKYAAIYSIPGFGGTRSGALREARRRRDLEPGTPAHDLARRTFYITLDPESGNGHHLFADSEVNGPRATALVEELIPKLDAELGLIADPSARLLTGHSSGAWSSLWLALHHPETFAAAWASAPDPVDFRAFQRVNIYEDDNFYHPPAASPDDDPIDHPSYTRDGQVTMTIRQENLSEEVLGPANTSGQQWDSWFAVFGPRDERGEPAALFDPHTGAIDHAIAERYRTHDIAHLLRSDPERLGPIFRNNIRLVVGSEDSFDLDEAVALLREELGRVWPQVEMEVTPGYIEIIDGFTHGGVRGADRVKGWAGEMLTHLRRHGHAEPAE